MRDLLDVDRLAALAFAVGRSRVSHRVFLLEPVGLARRSRLSFAIALRIMPRRSLKSEV
jgi:hypothetical protein